MQNNLFKKPKKSRATKEEMESWWIIAEAIVAAVPGEAMDTPADTKRLVGYAKLAYAAGARTAEDIATAVAAQRRTFPRATITAASIGNKYGDYKAQVRAQDLAAGKTVRGQLLKDCRNLGVSVYSSRFEWLYPESTKSPHEPQTWTDDELRDVLNIPMKWADY